MSPADPRDVVAMRAELRVALEVLATVPDRGERLRRCRSQALSYDEIGDRLGLSYTRVNRLIAEANDAIRAERLRLRMEERSRPQREERL